MSTQAGLPRNEGESAPGPTAVVPGANGGSCRRCEGPLTGKQTDFCSKACNGAWYGAAHPRINVRPDGKRAGTLKAAILTYLRENPGEHTKRQIGDAIHAFEHSVGTRLSELRRQGEPISVRVGPGRVRLYMWARP